MNRLLALIVMLVSVESFADGVFITSAGGSVTSISQQDVEAIFLGKKTANADGSLIRPCYLDAADVSESLFSKMKKTAATYSAYWNRMLFSGNGVPPAVFNSTESILDFVQKNPGALCYTRDANLSASVKKVTYTP